MASKSKGKGKTTVMKGKKTISKPQRSVKAGIPKIPKNQKTLEEREESVEMQEPLNLSEPSEIQGLSQTPFEQAPQVSTPILDKALEQQRVEEEKARKIAELDHTLSELSEMEESMIIITLQNTSSEDCAELKQRIVEIKSAPEDERTIPLHDLFMVERAFEVVEGKVKLELPASETVSGEPQKSSLFDGVKQAVSGLFSSLFKPKGKSDNIEPIAPE